MSNMKRIYSDLNLNDENWNCFYESKKMTY